MTHFDIHSYQPEQIVLEPQLKCFVPGYQPAIGDIDPMIKVYIRVLSIGSMDTCID